MEISLFEILKYTFLFYLALVGLPALLLAIFYYYPDNLKRRKPEKYGWLWKKYQADPSYIKMFLIYLIGTTFFVGIFSVDMTDPVSDGAYIALLLLALTPGAALSLLFHFYPKKIKEENPSKYQEFWKFHHLEGNFSSLGFTMSFLVLLNTLRDRFTTRFQPVLADVIYFGAFAVFLLIYLSISVEKLKKRVDGLEVKLKKDETDISPH